ncbi:MAG TPA: zf-HC2 domain-containing protein [Jatrophihabitantaceae bacterium]|nr:zf-HC2 domain-containing protein [Jatrophihabitantaceae bacterium]
MTDPFLHDDAAYVLGALGDDERLAFEEHLATCDECRTRVDEIRPVAALLGDLTVDDVSAQAVGDPGPPDTLLPAMRAKIRRERRRRWAGSAVAGLAAACIVTLVVVFASDRGHHNQPPAQAMTALVASPVHATARVEGTGWGTRISLACQYDVSYPSDAQYSLVVVDRSGNRSGAGSWRLVHGGTTHVVGSTAVARNDIDHIDVMVGNTPILQLDL